MTDRDMSIPKFYSDLFTDIYCGNALDVVKELPDESVDLVATDPPYGISFMGKEWDKALPDKSVWAECLRVLKPGAFAFVMSIPRADCLSRMIISLEDTGFLVNFSPIFWAFASGFPKAQDIGTAVDKRLGVERTIIGREKMDIGIRSGSMHSGRPVNVVEVNITEATSPQAKSLDGSYGGFQPKPAVEVIIVAMKPLSEKTYVDQALKNGKGITWLGDGRIPYESSGDVNLTEKKNRHADFGSLARDNQVYGQDNRPRGNYDASAGRFPANLLVSDDVLNDGQVRTSQRIEKPCDTNNLKTEWGGTFQAKRPARGYSDSGSFSRYFSLDAWWSERISKLPLSVQKTFPVLIVPKPTKSEKNKGAGAAVPRTSHGSTPRRNEAENKSPNNHPTVKPLKLMSYLITLGSQPGDTILDPFAGTGTTGVAAKSLGRKAILIDLVRPYCIMARHRLQATGYQPPL